MRLWTLHPRYLDRLRLVAVWREGLLAQAVLKGKTIGYKNHPQLHRFSNHPEPLKAISYYLYEVYKEAIIRGYKFDLTKINPGNNPLSIQTTIGQMQFEIDHLLGKLKGRSQESYQLLINEESVTPHPIFRIVPGEVEDWEKGVKNSSRS